MKLSEDFEIKQNSASSFSLIESYVGTDKKGKKKKIQSRESYYGTLYQALQGFLVQSSQRKDSLKEVRSEIYATIQALGVAQDLIKKEFRTEVKGET